MIFWGWRVECMESGVYGECMENAWMDIGDLANDADG